MSLTKDGFYKSFSGAIGNNNYLLEAGGGHIGWGNAANQIPYSNGTVNTSLNADMTDGLHVHGGRNNEANKIVRTDGSGYIQAGYINTNVSTEDSLSWSRVFFEYNNDGYIRKASISRAKTVFFGGQVGSPSVPIYWTGSAFATCIVSFGNSSYGEHNANNINDNGIKYYNANGPSTSLGASTGDGALYSQAYNTSWVGQIAQDYRNGGLYVRGKNNGTWQSWYRVWDNRTTYVSGGKGYIGGTEITQVNNSDTVDGYHHDRFQVRHYTTQRDFTDGTLITTDINYNVTNGDPFYLVIQGNTYGRRNSCLTQVQGYIYSNTIINYGVTHLGAHPITGIIAMLIGNNLCFWFPRQGYWEGYSIEVYSAYDYRTNRVTNVTNSTDPGGTKRVDLSSNTITTINSGNGYWANLSIQTSPNSATVPTFSWATFSRVSDHGVRAGTFRGLAVGSQTGEFIHMYERVAIGSPAGWGSRPAPSYGLATYGGAWLATDTGSVGIGTTSPSYKLHVAGSTYITDYGGIGTNPDSTYGRLVFPENNIAIGFRKNGSYKTSIQYMTTGNEALVFSTQQAVTSFIFKCGHAASNGSDWQSGVIGTPSVQIKQQSLYVNGYIANGSSPSYNLYVGGTAYISGQHYAAGYHHNSVDSDNYVLLAGGGYEAKSNYYRNLGGGNYITITVGGDANTYYPVVIGSPSDYYPYQFVNITRHYSETAPNTWNTSTHKGGLSMAIFWNGSSYWDGNASGSEAFVVRLYQSYSTMVGGVDNCVGGKVVWLRGGGANYHIFSMNGRSQSATVYLSTYTDGASRSFAPRTTPVTPTVQWPGDVQNGAGYLRDRSNGTATYTNYGAAGLGWGSITWLTCWNGYELRAISKAEMANVVNVYQHTTNNVDYPLVWSNQNNTSTVQANQLHKSYADLVYNPANKEIKTWSFAPQGENTNRGIHFPGGAWINSIGTNIIFRNATIRFGGSGWDWNAWAGLNFDGNTTINIGMPNNSHWTANSNKTAGTIRTVSSKIEIFPDGNSNFGEGLRIHSATNGWTSLVLCGTDLTAFNGTSANSWSLHTNGGNFYLNKNNSSGAVATRLWGHANGYTVGSTSRASANLTVTSWIEVTGGASATMSYATTNPRITFSENGSQAVGIVYTDYDSYRASKGLKVMDVDNTDTGNVWLEVQRCIYGNGIFASLNGSSTDNGLSLYGSDYTYALMFRGTGNRGKWGDVQSDWATYSTMSNTAQRGWVWQSGTAEANMSAALSVRGVFATRAVGNNAGYLAFPQNNSYYTSTATVTGALKVVLPRYRTNTMIMFDVNIFTYDEGTSNIVTYRIGGYEYGSTGWYAPVSKVFSWGRGDKVNLNIRFGYDGSNTCITIGETNTTWSYPQVSISNITYGYSDVAISSWGYGWGISFTTTLPSSVSTTFTDPYFNGMYWANQRVRPYSSTTTTPQFGKVMINTTSSSYQLNVAGDSWVSGWSRAGSGFYCEGNGVHYTHLGTYGEIYLSSNNVFNFTTGSWSTLYFNYGGSGKFGGTWVSNYVWHAGSTSTYADHNIGKLHVRPTSGNYAWNEGIRLHPASNGWATFILCGTDNTGDSGTSANSWSLHAYGGNFYLSKNGSTGGTSYMDNISNKWYFNTTSGGECVNIGGWVNTVGACGWYNSTYGGGMWMNDSTFVRVYNGKYLYTTYQYYDVGNQNYTIDHVYASNDRYIRPMAFSTFGNKLRDSGYLDGRYLRYSGWWNSGSGQSVDNASGMIFAYGNHGVPGSWGIVATFDYQLDSSYRLQLYGDGWNSNIYYRVRSSDRGGWYGGWKHIYDDGYHPLADKLTITGYQTDGLSFYQTDSSFDGSPASWAHYIIANHGNGASYYHYTLRLPFWGPPQYRRQGGSTSSVTQWYTFITTENGYWANQPIQTASSTATNPQFNSVNVGGTSTGYGAYLASGKRLYIEGTESNAIYTEHHSNGHISINSPESNAAIRHGFVFKWYDTYWKIGNVRGGSTNSAGFGIGYYAGSQLSLLVKPDLCGTNIYGKTANSDSNAALRVIKGWDCGNRAGYDTVVISSNNCTSLRLIEADGTCTGISAGDSKSILATTHYFQFYSGCSNTGTIYNGMGGTFRFGINWGNFDAWVERGLRVNASESSWTHNPGSSNSGVCIFADSNSMNTYIHMKPNNQSYFWGLATYYDGSCFGYNRNLLIYQAPTSGTNQVNNCYIFRGIGYGGQGQSYVATCEGNSYNLVVIGVFTLSRSTPSNASYTVYQVHGLITPVITNQVRNEWLGSHHTSDGGMIIRMDMRSGYQNYTTKTTINIVSAYGVITETWWGRKYVGLSRDDVDALYGSLGSFDIAIFTSKPSQFTNNDYNYSQTNGVNTTGRYLMITNRTIAGWTSNGGIGRMSFAGLYGNRDGACITFKVTCFGYLS